MAILRPPVQREQAQPGVLPPSDPLTGESYQPGGIGVFGGCPVGTGVQGEGDWGVCGFESSGLGPQPDAQCGVLGSSLESYGVYGSSGNYDGVKGVSNSPVHAGVSAMNINAGMGVFGYGNPAAYFDGDVQVTGDLILINSPASGDIAEDFDLEDDSIGAEPGTVLVINPDGKLSPCVEPYDTRVAGVVSGAGEFRPAVILQRIRSVRPRLPVALIGKAFCKVDASFGGVVGGDLLTTSTTAGHAMKVSDRSKALGTIFGKALGSLKSGRGLIPILVSLR